jgi:hypothetical protein
MNEIGIWRLLWAAPTVANILNHMQHDMHEFQVRGGRRLRPVSFSLFFFVVFSSHRSLMYLCVSGSRCMGANVLQPSAWCTTGRCRQVHRLADALRDTR